MRKSTDTLTPAQVYRYAIDFSQPKLETKRHKRHYRHRPQPAREWRRRLQSRERL